MKVFASTCRCLCPEDIRPPTDGNHSNVVPLGYTRAGLGILQLYIRPKISDISKNSSVAGIASLCIVFLIRWKCSAFFLLLKLTYEDLYDIK